MTMHCSVKYLTVLVYELDNYISIFKDKVSKKWN